MPPIYNGNGGPSSHQLNGFGSPGSVPPPHIHQGQGGGGISPGQAPRGMLPEDAPSYVKQRQGRRGEFRYF